jgi:hypothetical protein
LRLILESPARARLGEPVPLVFTVANPGGSPVALYLMGRDPTVDFQVTDDQGSKIWSRLHGQVGMAPLRLLPLEVGQHLSFHQVWNQLSDTGTPVPPGAYLIRAVLLTDDPGGLASPSARLRIEAHSGE